MLVRFLSVVLLAIPLSVVLTFMLIPLWRWTESTLGIESIGHSGPASWCFYIIFLLVVLILSVITYSANYKNTHKKKHDDS